MCIRDRVRGVRDVRHRHRQGATAGVSSRHDVREVQAARGATISARGVIGHRAARRLIVLIALAGLALDQVTKAMAVAWLDPMNPPKILGGLITFQLIRNPGAAFSMGENATVLFAVLAIVALVVVSVWLVPKVTARSWAIATGLLLAGVAGNLTDRLFRPPGVCLLYTSPSPRDR